MKWSSTDRLDSGRPVGVATCGCANSVTAEAFTLWVDKMSATHAAVSEIGRLSPVSSAAETALVGLTRVFDIVATLRAAVEKLS